MDTASLKKKIEAAKKELLKAQKELDVVLEHVARAERADKVMVSSPLRTALSALETATHELRDLEDQLQA
jgi:hypothetical protein